MTIPNVPKPVNPVLTDTIIVALQDILKDNLSWLDYSFGRCQKLVKTVGGQNFFYPAVHIENETYRSVLPDSYLGNFSFFEIQDPVKVDFKKNNFNRITCRYALVFWFNLAKIYDGDPDRNTEAIKYQILSLLSRTAVLPAMSRISVTDIYERHENIYKGYSIKEVDSQYLMQPYAGMRFEGELSFIESCSYGD